MKTIYYNNQKFNYNFLASFLDRDLNLYEVYFFIDEKIVLKCMLTHYELNKINKNL